MCCECGKRRVIYSAKRLSIAEERAVTRVQEELLYMCGSPLFPGGSLQDTILVKEGLKCSSPMEASYYAGMNIIHVSRVVRKPTFWIPTWSDTNQATQLQKMARGLKFRIKKIEGLYYLCSENKGTDQLCCYREADLRLGFLMTRLMYFILLSHMQTTKTQINL